MSGLRAVQPDDPGAQPPPAAVTAEAIVFPAEMSKAQLDKLGMLEVTFTMDPTSDVTNLDLRPLRNRLLRVRVEAVTSGGVQTDPREDPVAQSIRESRKERLRELWLDPAPRDLDARL